MNRFEKEGKNMKKPKSAFISNRLGVSYVIPFVSITITTIALVLVASSYSIPSSLCVAAYLLMYYFSIFRNPKRGGSANW